MSRNEILENIKHGIAINNNIPKNDVKYKNPMNHTKESLLEEYKLNQSNNKAIVLESDNLPKTINEILTEVNASKILLNTDLAIDAKDINNNYQTIPYTKSIDFVREELFNIDTSVVEARCGVANVGIVGLSSNPASPRLASLITNNCIYLLKKENIVESLHEGINFIKQYEKKRSNTEILPSNIIFVAGPSRTADIELQTIFGVHGPRVVYVVLY